MTSTTKYVGFSIVPWANSAEWKYVCSLVLKDEPNCTSKVRAHQIISQWQTRISLLPSGVEGTLCLLEAMIADSALFTDRQYCLFYGSCLMRFLNICVASRAQVYSFTKTVKSHSIPEWIASIRHDFAHSQRLPNMPILKLAVVKCYKWLQETYWIPESDNMNDYILKGEDHNIEESDAPFKLWVQSIVTIYNKFKFEDGVSSFEIECLNKDSEDVRNSFRVEHLEDIVKCFYICVDDLFDSHNEPNVIYKEIEKLLNQIQQNRLLPKLVSKLSESLIDDEILEVDKQNVSLWLVEIFKGLLIFDKRNESREGVPGFGLCFNHDWGSIELKQMKNTIFANINEKFKKCFKSYAALCGIEDMEGCDKFLADVSKATNPKLNFDNLIEMKDSVEISHITETRDEIEIYEACKTIQFSKPLKRKKRWVLELNTEEYECCPIGVMPHQLMTV